jgi:hypothetical protein
MDAGIVRKRYVIEREAGAQLETCQAICCRGWEALTGDGDLKV